MELDHKLNYRVFLTVFVLSYQVVITGFSSEYCLIKWLLQGFPQYLYCLIKWLLQGFPQSAVLSSGYYRVFLTVFVLSYQVVMVINIGFFAVLKITGHISQPFSHMSRPLSDQICINSYGISIIRHYVHTLF